MGETEWEQYIAAAVDKMAWLQVTQTLTLCWLLGLTLLRLIFLFKNQREFW